MAVIVAHITSAGQPRWEAVSKLHRRWGAARAAKPDIALDKWREMIEGWEVLTAEPGGVDYTETDAGGVPAMWAIPQGAAENRVILSIHGGGEQLLRRCLNSLKP